MIRQSARTGRTVSTSRIQREVIQAQRAQRIEPERHVFLRLRLCCHVRENNRLQPSIPI
jgi:hypothetical protein